MRGPPALAQDRRSWPARELRRLLDGAEKWSALAAHLLKALDNDLPDSVEREPSKPKVKLRPPLYMRDPPTLAQARTFPWYNFYLDALDTLNAISVGSHIIPIITTDRACAYPGMAVNRSTQPYLFDKVNGGEYWPLTYQQIQDVLRFHNRVIKAWASANGVRVIDIEASMPKKVELCSDIQHDLTMGWRLRAWLMFQELLPIIKADIALGRVPTPGSGQNSHPAFAEPIMRLDRLDVIAGFPN